MKILMVSMPSLHFYRWVNQLKDTEHEIYWFDVTGSGVKTASIDWVTQITNWKLRSDFIGRTFVKKHLSQLYKKIQKINERDLASSFEEALENIKPDAVHSFALYVSCSPIKEVMEKYSKLKWIYSSWGSDLFYFQNEPSYLKDIKKVLPRVDYMFSDCKRDARIAEQYGFKGEFLGVFPGGGGYTVSSMKEQSQLLQYRNTIIIKGYQGRSGRAINVLQAIKNLKDQLSNYDIVVFGADSDVIQFLNTYKLVAWKNLRTYERIPHNSILELMGKALIYIGNSASDGMPNTLLEAIIMGAFPIQSNPGGATAEIIEHKKNGLLIDHPESIEEISSLILYAIDDSQMIKKAMAMNMEISQNVTFEKIRKGVLEAYKKVENNLDLC